MVLRAGQGNLETVSLKTSEILSVIYIVIYSKVDRINTDIVQREFGF